MADARPFDPALFADAAIDAETAKAEFGYDPAADRPARMVDRRRCGHAGRTPTRRRAVSGASNVRAAREP
jgi:hypothetical protein